MPSIRLNFSINIPIRAVETRGTFPSLSGNIENVSLLLNENNVAVGVLLNTSI